jgi:GntR family transcriptional regulator, rspAB operon transcriptional repressor
MLRYDRTPSSSENEGEFVVRKSERAYQWLRDEILSFRMHPGMFIDKIEVCDKLSVSKQPVTAALTRLEQEGLVEIYPQRGSYVARLRLGAMSESLFIRGALEAAAARRIASEGNDVLLFNLRKNLESQETALASENMSRFYTLDMEFHTIIARAAPYQQVAHLIEVGLATVKRCHELFRPDAHSLMGSHQGHRRILSALEAHDGEVAAREMTEHVSDYTAMLRRFAETRPELFVG